MRCPRQRHLRSRQYDGPAPVVIAVDWRPCLLCAPVQLSQSRELSTTHIPIALRLRATAVVAMGAPAASTMIAGPLAGANCLTQRLVMAPAAVGFGCGQRVGERLCLHSIRAPERGRRLCQSVPRRLVGAAILRPCADLLALTPTLCSRRRHITRPPWSANDGTFGVDRLPHLLSPVARAL